jgi:hypothetical protein
MLMRIFKPKKDETSEELYKVLYPYRSPSAMGTERATV